jgi:pimeloyl-ACP methyl ester carboxylesterase
MAPAEATLRTRDVSARTLRAGTGRLLVFLHGAAGVPPWNAFFAALAEHYDVLVPEHPGFGRTPSPPWLRNVGDLAMYYLDVLDNLKAERVHLVGNSLGGWIAAELATRNCSRLASLSLISPAGVRVKGVPMGDNFIWGPQETVRNLYHDQALAEQLLAQPPTEEQAELLLVNRFAAAKLGWEPRWHNPALERWLHRISVPTLVVWGADDKFLPARYADAWRAGIPNATVEMVAACGHLPHMEKPDEAARKVLDFVRSR